MSYLTQGSVLIEKVIELNEYRSDTDFKIHELVLRLNCAKTQTNFAKIDKYISIINADFIADELFNDTIKFENIEELIVRIKCTDTMHTMQALIRFVKYLTDKTLYD